MRYKHQILNISSLERTRFWINRWEVLGYEVIHFQAITNVFGKVKKYLVVLKREYND